MNQRSEDPSRNIDIVTKRGINQSGLENLEVSSNLEGSSNLSGSIGENKNTGIVTDQGVQMIGQKRDFCKAIYLRNQGTKILIIQKLDNNSGRSLS